MDKYGLTDDKNGCFFVKKLWRAALVSGARALERLPGLTGLKEGELEGLGRNLQHVFVRLWKTHMV